MPEIVDIYKTIEAPSEGYYKEKGSKFPTFAFPVRSEDEIKDILKDIRKKYFDARHHCYAWRLGADKKRFRANDDGEPGSTAGKPILGQIQSHDLTNILIVVIRYFGGTKLGVSGLIHAYRTAASDAIANATIIEKTVHDFYRVNFDYSAMNNLMHFIKENKLEQSDQQFDLKCSLTLAFRQRDTKTFLAELQKIDTIKLEFLRSE